MYLEKLSTDASTPVILIYYHTVKCTNVLGVLVLYLLEDKRRIK